LPSNPSTTMSSATTSKREKAAKNLTTFAKAVQAVAKPAVSVLVWFLPLAISYCRFLHTTWKKIPYDASTFLIGIVFCFFGGLYPTLFAALQAAKHSGISTVRMACSALADEALVIIEESKKDDDVDADGDGKADVKQIGKREYAIRKTRLVMAKMNPEKVDSAVASIYKVWLAVAAVLKIQFARTINMALGIAEFINKPVDRFLRPTIQVVVPDEYDRWVPIVLSWITKSIAMSIAWYIQTIISAATSAMQGGLQMARALMRMGRKRGVKFLPADHETYIDEVAAYIFAGLGFYFQFSLHFDVPFPFNWLLWPFELAEWWIRWTITKAD